MTALTVADGTEISFADHGGSGPPVLLVHGITENSQCWAPVTDSLTNDHRMITMDLRGHGNSGFADRYDLEAMAGDVVAVIDHLELFGSVHLIGHSLGGAVVSAVGAAAPVASVINVDQSLQLGAFKAQLVEIESMLRDPETFPEVIAGVFAQLAGDKISPAEIARVNELRRPDQDVVLGVWELMFAMSEAEVNATVEGALAGYAGASVPYLSLFGVDPGPGYAEWLAGYIDGAAIEVWADHGHYPHLVDPARFTSRVRSFVEASAAG